MLVSGTSPSGSSSWWRGRSWTCKTPALWERSWAGTASLSSLDSSSTGSFSSLSSTWSWPGRTRSRTSVGCCRPWSLPWQPPPGQGLEWSWFWSGTWCSEFDFNLFSLQFCHAAYHHEVSVGELPRGPADRPLRPACRCHHQHGRHSAVWGGGGHLYCSGQWLRAGLRTAGHHQVNKEETINNQ